MSAGTADFSTTVIALWERLGLAAPRFAQPGRVQMRIEQTRLDLTDDGGRGYLRIEGAAARLASDPAARSKQIRKILETNLGLLIDNEAGVYVETLPAGQTILTVLATYSYDTGVLDRLVKKIEDVLQMIEFYSGEMQILAAPEHRRKAAVASHTEATVIFRL